MPTIIFKATEACNANCIYCDVVHRKKPRTIPLDLLKVAFERFNEYLLEYPHERVNIIWHGGEPCMAGVELYKAALRFADEVCPQTKDRIGYDTQSNLTMINQEFVDVFKQMGMTGIGTSYEPIPGIRGLGKVRDSKLYNQKFLEGTNLLEKNGLTWGFIYVVTKQVLDRPVELLYHLSNLKLRGGFDLHPVLVYNEAAEECTNVAITQEEYADFLGAMFAEWWKHRDRFPQISPFDQYLKHYTSDYDGLGCCDAPWCGLHLYIGPDGETAQCGRASDWDILMYGNIRDKSLKEIFADSRRAQIDSRRIVLKDSECRGCKYWQLCHGGCPLDAYNLHKDFMHKTDQCLSKKLFLQKYFEPITGLQLTKRDR
ncbi:MAG: radical SAM protein [Muribaculaceae bacterium]